MWRTFHWTSKWSDCLPRTSALQLLFPAIKSELRHPTENLVLKVLLPQSFSLLTARRKTIKILPNVFCVIDYPQIFQGAPRSWLGKSTFLAQHTMQYKVGMALCCSKALPKTKFHQLEYFLQECAVAPASFYYPPMLNKKPAADHRRGLWAAVPGRPDCRRTVVPMSASHMRERPRRMLAVKINQ